MYGSMPFEEHQLDTYEQSDDEEYDQYVNTMPRTPGASLRGA